MSPPDSTRLGCPRRWFVWVLAAVLAGAAPGLARADDQLPVDVLRKVKKATVYLRVTRPDKRVIEGSGFFAGTNFVITNAHVVGMLSPDGRPPRKIEVVVNSGEPDQKVFLGRLAQTDPDADLAVVAVLDKPLPERLRMVPAKDLVETQTLFVVGFPLGKELGQNITVSKTSVSSLRKGPGGTLRIIQVNGGMHPGNSGGPVIDAKGQVVGLAVAGVRGTQINFAIPTEAVQRFLNCRVHTRTFLRPYREGDSLKLPLRVRMVDPLVIVKKVMVTCWTGRPGQQRKAIARIGVAPLPDDSPKQSFDLTYRGREAVGDIVLPKVAKDQAIWLQFSYTRTDGQTTWLAARPYANRFEPVERIPVVLAYRHNPDRPARLDLTVTTDLKLRALSGTDKHLVNEIKAQLLERLIGKPDANGAMNGLLTFSQVTEKLTLDKHPLPEDRILQNSLRFVRSLRGNVRVDNQGDLHTLKLYVAGVRNRVTVADLLGLGSHVLLALEAVTVPLPGQEVTHERSWKTKRTLQLGSFRNSQKALMEVTYIYHGMRVRNGRKVAVVFLGGQVQGGKSGASGKMHGQAVVDLQTGQVVYADTNLNLDLDVTNGRETFQANGTLHIALLRQPLEGAERDKLLKGPSPRLTEPVKRKDDRIAAAVARVASGEMFAFLSERVKSKGIADVDERGFRGSKTTFREALEEGALLIGFEVGLQGPSIGSLRPIYLTRAGEKMGEWHGKVPAKAITVKARAGYVVGSINIRTGLWIDGLSLKFVKLGKDRLQLDDHYSSDWIGGMGGNPSAIGVEGSFQVGICGHLNNQGRPCALGLISVLRKE